MNTENNRPDYYEILEVDHSATQHDITLAYERAKKTYSSQNPALEATFSADEALMIRTLIDEAFQVLSNQTYRNIYEKRRQSKHFSESDLTLDSLKKASVELFPEFPKRSEPAAPTYQVDSEMEKMIAQKKDWVGEDLKKVREYKGVSIEQMHEKTKINPWYLTAIEKMDAQNLPAAVFVRGYVVQIARMLQLSDSVVADSYMKVYRKKVEN